MEVIIKNGNDFELKNIDDLKFEQETNEAVIVDFTLTAEERTQIEWWSPFRYDEVITIWDEAIATLEEREYEINLINAEFESKVRDKVYSNTIGWVKFKMPEEEIRTWDLRLIEARKVVAWESSNTIDLAKPDWVTSMQYSQYLIGMWDAKNVIYLQLEKEKNTKLALIQ